MFQDITLISPKMNPANTLRDKSKSSPKPHTGAIDENPDFFYLSDATALDEYKLSDWVYEWPRNSTSLFVIPEEVANQFQKLFDAAKYDIFEYGMESKFSRNLLRLVRQYGDISLQILTTLIVGEKASEETAAEALRWIGKIEDPRSHKTRRIFLERCLLKCKSARVKDGAGLGIAALDDSESIPSVEQAIAEDIIDDLRQDLTQVLIQLKETKAESVL